MLGASAFKSRNFERIPRHLGKGSMSLCISVAREPSRKSHGQLDKNSNSGFHPDLLDQSLRAEPRDLYF